MNNVLGVICFGFAFVHAIAAGFGYMTFYDDGFWGCLVMGAVFLVSGNEEDSE